MSGGEGGARKYFDPLLPYIKTKFWPVPLSNCVIKLDPKLQDSMPNRNVLILQFAMRYSTPLLYFDNSRGARLGVSFVHLSVTGKSHFMKKMLFIYETYPSQNCLLKVFWWKEIFGWMQSKMFNDVLNIIIYLVQWCAEHKKCSFYFLFWYRYEL